MTRKNTKELDSIRDAVHKILDEKKKQNMKCSLNYTEVAKLTDISKASVAGYLHRNYKELDLYPSYGQSGKPCEYRMREHGCLDRLKSYLSKSYKLSFGDIDGNRKNNNR